jgi:hypothetical protein
MRGETHTKIGRIMYPNIKRKIIQEVNHVIDNPAFIDTFMNNQYPKYNNSGEYDNNYDYLHLGDKTPHRRVNHDSRSAIWAGYRVAGYEGAKIAMNHLFLDKLSDNLAESYGTEGRDVAESILIYLRKRQYGH